MSIKRKYETKTHTITENVIVEEWHVCDVCRKKIETNSYWELTTHHNDCGNDSNESYEYFDVCSKECLRKKFEEYIEQSDNDYNTMFFEVERV